MDEDPLNPSPRRNRPTRVRTERLGKQYLVVGGNGLLGSHLVEGLLARGETHIRIFDRVRSSLFDYEIGQGTVRFHQGNLGDVEAIRRACRGVQVVFHTAASVNFWHDLPFEYDAMHAVNATGTENVVAACLAEDVRQLIHTSSNSVVVSRDVLKYPLEFADETAPYATPPFICHYIATKIIAERAVLAANGRGQLSTAALRPGGLYGPRDTVFGALAKRGYPGVGLPSNTIDHVYVENVVHAFLLLERRLMPDGPCGGKAYFLTNYSSDGPRCDSYFDFHTKLFRAFGRRFRLGPAALWDTLAWISKTAVQATNGWAERWLGELRKLRPCTLLLSRSTYYFSCRRAQKDFGYEPLYSVDEAIALTAAWWR